MTGLSAVVAWRGGADALREAIGAWALDAAIGEIVAVSFGGAGSAGTVAGLPKTVELRAGAGEPWGRGLALNLGIEAARGETILVLDPCDALAGAGSYWQRIETEGGFWTSYGATGWSELVMLRRDDWASVGGFHEYLLESGFEDENLFNRLEDAGVAHRFVDREHVVRGAMPQVPGDGGGLGIALPEGLERNRRFQIGRNKILAGLSPWSEAMPRLRPRRFGRPNDRTITCDLAPRTRLERRLQDCASYLAARFLHDASEEVAFPMLRDMIDERSGGYEARAKRQHQIDLALAARAEHPSRFDRTG